MKCNNQDCREAEESTKIACDLCGRRSDPAKLNWSDLSDRQLCAECLAEEDSCGCAD